MAVAIDSEARHMATQALSKIESHENECARRYAESADASRELRDEVRAGRKEVREDVITLHRKVDAIQKRNFHMQLAALIAIAGLLLSIVAYFTTSGRPWQPRAEIDTYTEGSKNG
ncbi:MAG: hypothetical protein Q7S99_05295 [Parvibaculum sp.]|nr:hypothetical protein [Parvibaculum sp.]